MGGRIRRWGISCLLFAGAACRATGGSEPPTTDAAEGRRADTDALARRIDAPGMQPLADDIPDWLARELGVHPESATADHEVDPALADAQFWNEEKFGSPEMAAGMFTLLRGIVSREQSLQRGMGDDIDTMVELYSMYDHFVLDEPERDAIVEATIAAWRADVAPQQREQARHFVDLALDRADALRRHTLAQLLRTADVDDPRLAPALLAASMHSSVRERAGLEILLARESVRREGHDAEATSWLELARACFVGLQLDCGDEAVREAKTARHARTAEVRTQLHEIAALRTHTQKAIELADATSVDDRIALARALVDLHRFSAASRLFDALSAERPTDARAFAGTLEIRLRRDEDGHVAGMLLDNLDRLDHVDLRVRQLAFSLRAYRMYAAARIAMATSGALPLPTIATDVRVLLDDARMLEAAGDVQGTIVRLVGERVLPALDRGDIRALEATAAGLLPAAMELQSRFPQDPDAYRFVLAATVFSTDENATFAAFALPVPKYLRRELRRERAAALFAAMVAWGRFDGLLPLFEQSLAAIDVDERMDVDAARMLFDMLDIAGKQREYDWNQVASWQAEALANGTFGDPALFDAVGVALVEAGRPDEGVVQLRRALPPKQGASVLAQDAAVLNLVAIEAMPIEQLEPLTESTRIDVRVLALAMLAQRSQGAARARWRRALADARAEQCKTAPRSRPLPGAAELLVARGLRFGLKWADGKLVYLVAPHGSRGALVHAAVEPLAAVPCPKAERRGPS